MKMMKQMMEMMKVQNKPQKKKRKRLLTKYCHTHGLCNHDSPDCHTPAEGHKNEATLQNRMGGSIKNISWKEGPVNSNNVDCKINNFTKDNTIPVAQPNNNAINLKAESGASKHFVKTVNKKILLDIQKAHSTTVVLPDETNLRTEQKGTLPISNLLSKEAQQGHVLHGLSNSSLLSIGQLCDNKCIAIFDKRTLHVLKN